jgi:hypothetical protein
MGSRSLGRSRHRLGAQQLLEREVPDRLEIAIDVEERGVAVGEVEMLRLRLTRPGGQIDPRVALPQRLRLQFDEETTREPLSSQVSPRPDAFEFGGPFVVTLESAAGDRLALSKQKQEIAVWRRERFRGVAIELGRRAVAIE